MSHNSVQLSLCPPLSLSLDINCITGLAAASAFCAVGSRLDWFDRDPANARKPPRLEQLSYPLWIPPSSSHMDHAWYRMITLQTAGTLSHATHTPSLCLQFGGFEALSCGIDFMATNLPVLHGEKKWREYERIRWYTVHPNPISSVYSPKAMLPLNLRPKGQMVGQGSKRTQTKQKRRKRLKSV